MDSEFSPTDLRHLLPFIASIFRFTPEKYARLRQPNTTEVDVFEFAVNHSHKHLAKALGAIAAECERVDHDGVIMDRIVLQRSACKLALTALNFANVVGLTPEQLLEGMLKELR